MEQYYSVFDFTKQEEGDSITIKMGLKNPKFKKNPDVPGGGGDADKPSNKSDGARITVVILAIVIVIATLGLLYTCIMRKKRSSTFNVNKDYGAIKMGGQGTVQ